MSIWLILLGAAAGYLLKMAMDYRATSDNRMNGLERRIKNIEAKQCSHGQ